MCIYMYICALPVYIHTNVCEDVYIYVCILYVCETFTHHTYPPLPPHAPHICIHTNVCKILYIYIYICTYVHIYVRIYINMYICAYICIHVCVSPRIVNPLPSLPTPLLCVYIRMYVSMCIRNFPP